MSKKRTDPDSGSKRFHVVVPAADDQVLAWLNAQANISFSIRILIKAYIAKFGCVDPMYLSPTDFRNIFSGQTGNAEIIISETENTADMYSDDVTGISEAAMDVITPVSPIAQPVSASVITESTESASRGTILDEMSNVSTSDSISKSNTMIEDMLNL